MENKPNPIEAFRKKLFIRLAVLRFTRMAAVFLFSWGFLCLIVKAVSKMDTHMVINGFYALIPLFFISFIFAKKDLPGTGKIRAAIDNYNGFNGLFMAEAEADASLWKNFKKDIAVPDVKFCNFHRFFIFALSAFFAGAMIFVPETFIPPDSGRMHDIKNVTKNLESRIELLEKQEIISKSDGEKLINELKNLEKNIKTADIARIWETFDHIQNSISQKADKSSKEFLNEMEALTRAGEIIDELKSLKASENAEKEKKLMNLASVLSTADKKPYALTDENIKNLLSDPDIKKLEKMAHTLSKKRAMIKNKLEAMSKAGLLKNKISAHAGKIRDKELKAFLEAEEKKRGSSCTSTCLKPGKGGSGRGRADAVMTWKDKTGEYGLWLKEEVLPSGSLSLDNDSVFSGFSITDPKKNRFEIPSGGGLLDTGKGVTDTKAIKILPRHRGPVKRYFGKEPDKKQGPVMDEIWSGWS